jgi:acetylornithine deacetylase/succinyl-diaminopimelate desuccinylase-like protein
MVLAAAGVPAAMLFVRSLNGGISHSPDELSSAEDIALAVDALTETLGRLSAAHTSRV